MSCKDIILLLAGGALGFLTNLYFYLKAKKQLAEVKKWLLTFSETEIHPFEEKANFYKNNFPEGSPQEPIRRYFEDIQSMAHDSRNRVKLFLENINVR